MGNALLVRKSGGNEIKPLTCLRYYATPGDSKSRTYTWTLDSAVDITGLLYDAGLGNSNAGLTDTQDVTYYVNGKEVGSSTYTGYHRSKVYHTGYIEIEEKNVTTIALKYVATDNERDLDYRIVLLG